MTFSNMEKFFQKFFKKLENRRIREKTRDNTRWMKKNSQEWSNLEVANLTILDYYISEDQERSKIKERNHSQNGSKKE